MTPTKVFPVALLAGALAQAASISTTMTLNATGPLSGSSVTLTGTASFTGSVGSGSFTGTVPIAPDSSGNLTSTFKVAFSGSSDTLTGTITLPYTGIVSGAQLTNVKCSITGGTGTYQNASGSFTLAGSGLVNTITAMVTLSFTGPGTIVTGFGSSTGTPTIAGLENNYSFLPPGSPNYGIAEGSIFDIFGTDLADSSTGLQTAPLQTTLAGVSVAITVNGVTKQALLYYVTPTQIAAILPSSVPVGTGQITVTNNGATSAAAPIVVVQSAFGMLTLNNGSGPSAAFDSNNNLLNSTNAAHAGDTIVLWGTGAGPVPNDNQQSAVTTPLEVDIGTVPAVIAYKGRSAYPGLDQLNVVVPQGISGCYVSIVVRTGNISSNFSSIPVTTSGTSCSDPYSPLGISPAQLQSLTGKTSFATGFIQMIKVSTAPVTIGGLTTPGEDLQTFGAGFGKITLAQPFDPSTQLSLSSALPSVGSCVASTYVVSISGSSSTTTPAPPSPLPIASETLLNPGPAMNITGPDGSISVPCALGGCAGSQTGGTSGMPDFIPDSGGTFTFNNGSGGPDVPTFNVQVPVNAAVWSNQGSFSTVNRSQPATFTWTGGDANTYVLIIGNSGLGLSSTTVLEGSFTCVAPSSAQRFTVPASVLSALPPSQVSLGLSEGNLLFNSYTAPIALNIPGLDFAFYSGNIARGVTTAFQ